VSKAKIFYFTMQDEQTKEEKLDWFERTKFEEIPFDHITPDQKANWINLTDNDFDSFLPLIDKEVKAGKSQEAVFQLFSAGVKTQRDEWVYDFSKDALIERMKYFVEVYGDRLESGVRRELDIKWDPDLERHLGNKISKKFEVLKIRAALYRHFGKVFFYFDGHFNGRTYQMFNLFPKPESENKLIGFMGQSAGKPFCVLATDVIPDLNSISPASGGTQCLPLYRYDKDGNRIDNITDWALEQFRDHYRNELSQARGLSPLLPMSESSEQARGLSPLFENQQQQQGSKQLWFVTFVTHNSRISERMVTYGVEMGEPLIFSAEDQIFVAGRITEAAKRYEVAIATFNVLPDHVHMVVAAETERELNEHIRKIKGFSSREFQQSRNWDKGQHVWAQKFNRQPIEDETALTNILDYVRNNHIKHTERWGEGLISTWENGLPDKGLKSLVEIVGDGCVLLEDIFNQQRTRGLSPLPSGATVTKLDIFHYTYAVLHHPAYRTKYELNLKREFPRLPFYADFHQWATWGKALMELHLNYEAIEPYRLTHQDIASKDKPKAKLKADKTQGIITLDENTQLTDVPALAWDYKLGNRSALEWILDQYKEKKPKDPTIAKLFNTYKFADYKEHVIDLLQRVCTVSVKTMEIIQQMPDTVEHEA